MELQPLDNILSDVVVLGKARCKASWSSICSHHYRVSPLKYKTATLETRFLTMLQVSKWFNKADWVMLHVSSYKGWTASVNQYSLSMVCLWEIPMNFNSAAFLWYGRWSGDIHKGIIPAWLGGDGLRRRREHPTERLQQKSFEMAFWGSIIQYLYR